MAFFPQSLGVISQKFMAAGLTHSICSPKLGSVQKCIRKVHLLPSGGRIGSQAKQEDCSITNQLTALPGAQAST